VNHYQLSAVVLSAGLGLFASGAAMADGMPSRGYVAPPERPWSVEVGARYWYSVGTNAYDYFDTTGTLLVSRLSYEDMTAHSGEAFFRVDHKSGLFLKGFLGAGAIVDGTLFDEDFPPTIDPYSKTSSTIDGDLSYITVDLGFTFYDSTRRVMRGLKDGPVDQRGIRIGGFIGYNYWHEKADAFGCTQLATNPVICVPGAVLPTDKVITEKDTWRSVRLGLIADAMLSNRLKITGEAAYLISDQKALDVHYFTFGPDPASGDGWGYQLEAILAYDVTSNFNIGVGGRWWHMETDARDALFNQVLRYETDRYGVFVQGSLKLN
jgi:hypothetical protein